MEWFEDETFWVDFSALLISEERHEEAAAQVESSPLLAVPHGAEVLDLGCGPGVYSVPLARRGASVTGVDLIPAMLDQARDAARASGVELRLVESDMREFVAPDSFDLIVNMYTSFGYFVDQEENVAVLRNARRSLQPGGRLIVDLFGKELLAESRVPLKVLEVDGGTLFRRGVVQDDWSWFRNELTFVRDGRARHGVIEHHLYSAVELRSLFTRAGFTDVACFGGFDGRAYGPGAQRLVVQGTRTA